jgi:hypothetical protein
MTWSMIKGLRPQCGGVARWPVGRIWFERSWCAVLGLSLGDRPVYAPGPQEFRYSLFFSVTLGLVD